MAHFESIAEIGCAVMCHLVASLAFSGLAENGAPIRSTLVMLWVTFTAVGVLLAYLAAAVG